MNLIRTIKRYLKYVRLVYKKPLLVCRIINTYFKIYVFKKQLLRKVSICLTTKCLCDCDKCSSATLYDHTRKELNLEEIKEIAKQSLKLGVTQFVLTGGEPLLRKDIFEIIKALQPAKVFVSIGTTGLLLDEVMIKKLKLAGVDMIKMSLDSPLASEHDNYRKCHGNYKKIIENLRLIKQIKGIRSHISTVTLPENIRSGKVLDILKIAEKFNATLALTIPAPAGRWSNNYSMLINAEDRERLNGLLKRHHLVTEDIDAGYRESKCPAGTECIYITCYGDVIPCSVLQISFGNIRKEKIKLIYQRMIRFQPLRKSVPFCKAGESTEFIEQWLKPIAKSQRFPVAIAEHPSYLKSESKK